MGCGCCVPNGKSVAILTNISGVFYRLHARTKFVIRASCIQAVKAFDLSAVMVTDSL